MQKRTLFVLVLIIGAIAPITLAQKVSRKTMDAAEKRNAFLWACPTEMQSLSACRKAHGIKLGNGRVLTVYDLIQDVDKNREPNGEFLKYISIEVSTGVFVKAAIVNENPAKGLLLIRFDDDSQFPRLKFRKANVGEKTFLIPKVLIGGELFTESTKYGSVTLKESCKEFDPLMTACTLLGTNLPSLLNSSGSASWSMKGALLGINEGVEYIEGDEHPKKTSVFISAKDIQEFLREPPREEILVEKQ